MSQDVNNALIELFINIRTTATFLQDDVTARKAQDFLNKLNYGETLGSIFNF